MSDWPVNCEEPDCGHEATICIGGRLGGEVFLCICHATECLQELRAGYERRLQLEQQGCDTRIAVARVMAELFPGEMDE